MNRRQKCHYAETGGTFREHANAYMLTGGGVGEILVRCGVDSGKNNTGCLMGLSLGLGCSARTIRAVFIRIGRGGGGRSGGDDHLSDNIPHDEGSLFQPYSGKVEIACEPAEGTRGRNEWPARVQSRKSVRSRRSRERVPVQTIYSVCRYLPCGGESSSGDHPPHSPSASALQRFDPPIPVVRGGVYFICGHQHKNFFLSFFCGINRGFPD